jgi:thiol:disulfide interchange protein
MAMRRWVAVVVMWMTVSVAAWAADKPFDPSRDPAKDLQAAIQQAEAQHKNILMDVGGNWCSWCLLLERTLTEDTDLHSLLEQNYVVLHVNWSMGQQNQGFLGKYPPAKGYPAWYVLSAQGRLLKAEDTSELEQTHKLGAGYNKDALRKFLEENAPKPLYHPVG